MIDLAQAQAQLRYSYRSASVGQMYGGALWLASVFAWVLIDTTAECWF